MKRCPKEAYEKGGCDGYGRMRKEISLEELNSKKATTDMLKLWVLPTRMLGAKTKIRRSNI